MKTLPLLVSVIIPVYNRGNLALRAIGSVVSQTYPAIEIIVVDDGSTDGTSELIEAVYPDIKIIRKINGGVSSARNAGITASTGEYIAFLDSDDLWEPSKIDTQVTFLERHHDFGFCFTDVKIINMNLSVLEIVRRRHLFRADGDMFASISVHPYLWPSSIMVKNFVFEKIGLFRADVRTAEDIDLFLKLSYHFKGGLIEDTSTLINQADVLGDSLSSAPSATNDRIKVVTEFIRANSNVPAAVRADCLTALYTSTMRSTSNDNRVSDFIISSSLSLRNARTPLHIKAFALAFAKGLLKLIKGRLRIIFPSN